MREADLCLHLQKEKNYGSRLCVCIKGQIKNEFNQILNYIQTHIYRYITALPDSTVGQSKRGKHDRQESTNNKQISCRVRLGLTWRMKTFR